jgi:hypothetical protein
MAHTFSDQLGEDKNEIIVKIREIVELFQFLNYGQGKCFIQSVG